MPNFLVFQQYGQSKSGLTKIFQIQNRAGDIIGAVRWQAPWRRYVASFVEAIILDGTCLEEVQLFLRRETVLQQMKG